jgi:hypothetical protein
VATVLWAPNGEAAARWMTDSPFVLADACVVPVAVVADDLSMSDRPHSYG